LIKKIENNKYKLSFSIGIYSSMIIMDIYEMIQKNKLVKIIEYIDYLYLNNYIKNSLKYGLNNNKNNELKIFSTHFNIGKQKRDEQLNILNLIQSIVIQNEFNYEIFLITIHIYRKICIQYAHLIDNYVYLFGAIYITLNKILCDKFLSNKFLSDILDIEPIVINKMVMCIDKFIDDNDIYFGMDEIIKITNSIYYS